MIPGNGPLPSSSHPALSTCVANNHTLAGPANENKYLPMSADSFPLQRKKKKRAAGLGHRNPRHTEQSWWSLSPWLVWPFRLGSLWKAPPLHLGEEQGWAGTVVHLFFPLRKNSLRQASSSDTWLIFDPHASLFFPLRCGGISKREENRGCRFVCYFIAQQPLRLNEKPYRGVHSRGSQFSPHPEDNWRWGRRWAREELSGHCA